MDSTPALGKPRLFAKLLIWIFSLANISTFAFAEFRTYTSAYGKTVTAEAISIRGDRLKLRADSGKIYEVSVASLSETDQIYLEAWKKKFPGVVRRDVVVRAAPHESSKVNDQRVLSYQVSVENKEGTPLENTRLQYQVHSTEKPGGAPMSGEMALPNLAAGGSVQVVTSKLGLGRSWKSIEPEWAGILLRVVSGDRVLSEGRLEARPGALAQIHWYLRIAETTVTLADLPDEPTPRIDDRDLRLHFRFRVPPPFHDGVLLTQGGKFNGYSCYLLDRKLFFAVRLDRATEPSRVSVPLPQGLEADTEVSVVCKLEGERISIEIKGCEPASTPVEKWIEETPTLPLVLDADENLGFSEHAPDIRFDGEVTALRLDIWKPMESPEVEGLTGTGPKPLLTVTLEDVLKSPPVVRIKDRDFTLSCNFEGLRNRDRGAVTTHGGGQYGQALYLREGRVWYAVRRSPDEEPARISVLIPLGAEAVQVRAGLSGGSIYLSVDQGETEKAPIAGPVSGNPTAPLVLGPDDLKGFSSHCPIAPFSGRVTALRLDVWGDEGSPEFID